MSRFRFSAPSVIGLKIWGLATLFFFAHGSVKATPANPDLPAPSNIETLCGIDPQPAVDPTKKIIDDLYEVLKITDAAKDDLETALEEINTKLTAISTDATTLSKANSVADQLVKIRNALTKLIVTQKVMDDADLSEKILGYIKETLTKQNDVYYNLAATMIDDENLTTAKVSTFASAYLNAVEQIKKYITSHEDDNRFAGTEEDESEFIDNLKEAGVALFSQVAKIATEDGLGESKFRALARSAQRWARILGKNISEKAGMEAQDESYQYVARDGINHILDSDLPADQKFARVDKYLADMSVLFKTPGAQKAIRGDQGALVYNQLLIPLKNLLLAANEGDGSVPTLKLTQDGRIIPIQAMNYKLFNDARTLGAQVSDAFGRFCSGFANVVSNHKWGWFSGQTYRTVKTPVNEDACKSIRSIKEDGFAAVNQRVSESNEKARLNYQKIIALSHEDRLTTWKNNEEARFESSSTNLFGGNRSAGGLFNTDGFFRTPGSSSSAPSAPTSDLHWDNL